MKKAGWQIIVGLIIFLSAIVISFESENALNSHLWSSLSVITALFTIHHQTTMPKKENSNE